MRELVSAYETRYHRQLRDVGIATALAQHDPKKLDQLLPPPTKATNTTNSDEKWW